MNEFKKIYGKRYAEENNEEEVKLYFSNIIKDDNISSFQPNNMNVSLPTEQDAFYQNESNSNGPINTEEMIGDKDEIHSIKKNEKKPVMINAKNVYGPGEQNKTTKKIKENKEVTQMKTKEATLLTQKKRGSGEPKSKKKERHTKKWADNKRCKCGTTFMEVIYDALNKRCKPYNLKFNRPNFKKLFGWNCIQYNKFIISKFYQIFEYEDENNKNIIDFMTKEIKDEIFIFIMRCTYEYLYDKFIKGENTISINDNEFSLTSFKEAFDKRRKKLIEKEVPLNEIEEEINDLIEYSKIFIKEIKGNGDLRQRKLRKTEINIFNYIVRNEFENDFYNENHKNE